MYGDAPADLTESSVSFSAETIARALRSIYRREVDVRSELEENLLRETIDIFSRAVATGVSDAVNDGDDMPRDEFLYQLKHNVEVFSAFRTHRMQNDIAARLTDDEGKLRTFSQFRKAVEGYTDHQNHAWLRTEYDTAIRRAHQAADWQQIEAEKDVLPNLEWIPSTSPTPGADHRVFWGTVLPVDDPFWKEHRPGDRWNCKCELRNTDKDCTARPSGTEKDNPQSGLENNPGKDGHLFSDKHPYYPDSCASCQFSGNKLMALFHDLAGSRKHCNSCRKVEKVVKETKKTGNAKRNEYRQDKVYGKRLMIGKEADKTELEDNIRAAKDLLDSFKEMTIKIREHVLINGVPNPEYEINGLIADRKGIEGEKGITSAFKKAIKQGCQTVVIDLDMHMGTRPLPSNQLSKYIDWRRKDFETETIKECYIIYRGRAVLIDKSFISREEIANELEKLKQ